MRLTESPPAPQGQSVLLSTRALVEPSSTLRSTGSPAGEDYLNFKEASFASCGRPLLFAQHLEDKAVKTVVL